MTTRVLVFVFVVVLVVVQIQQSAYPTFGWLHSKPNLLLARRAEAIVSLALRAAAPLKMKEGGLLEEVELDPLMSDDGSDVI